MLSNPPSIDLKGIFEIEPLHPDLVPYRQEREGIGTVIHHPLIISIMHHDMLNKSINQRYVLRKAEIAEAIEKEKWSRYVYLHERPYRFDALQSVIDLAEWYDTESIEFWQLIGSVWTDSENIYEAGLAEWRELWSSSIDGREHAMCEQERASLAAMPETFKIWRGANHADVLEGLSWTCDRAKAVWFAKRYTGIPHLAAGIAHKGDVLAYFSGRNEKEIVIFPEDVTKVKITQPT